MTTPPYPYASGDLLENRNTYFYTPFGGQAFLGAWRRQRADALSKCASLLDAVDPPKDEAPIAHRLQMLQAALEANDLAAHRTTLDRILQRFEVSKRLHDNYTPAWRPADSSRYHGLERYILLAEILGHAASLTADLRYLNGLLKCIDTLTAMPLAAEHFGNRLRVLLEQERLLIDRLVARASMPQRHTTPWGLPPAINHQPATLLHGIGLIASPTARSQAYIQALTASGLHPEFVLLLDDHAPKPSITPLDHQFWHGIHQVHLDEPVPATCQRAGIPTYAIPAVSINAPAAKETIQRLQPDTLIYSGAGGQIVSPETLDLGARFLHMHAGHIPEYRGSTTIYYALLNGQLPTVTAIFLDAQIDTGGILARNHYPAPDRSIDIDRVYDASIRADTLVRLLRDYVATGSFAAPRPQRQDEGITYFVIHPILKHLAILGLPEHENA